MSRRFRSLSITNSRGAPAPSGGITICHENNRLAPHELRAESFRGGPPIHIAQKPQENRHTRERFSLYRPIRDGRCAVARSRTHRADAAYGRLSVGLEAMVDEHRPAARLCQARKTHPVRSSQVVRCQARPCTCAVRHLVEQPVSHWRKCRRMSAAFGLSVPIVLRPQRPNDRRRHWRT
jgi:hypothetical protein